MSKRIYILFFLLLMPGMTLAAIPEAHRDDNLFTYENEKPFSLFFDNVGGFYGYTETGKFYTQRPVENTFGIKLHKFVIEEEFFYVSDFGRINAPSDLSALSIYLSKV